MPAFGPPHKPPEQQRLHARERLFGDHGTVILRPAPQHGVQQSNEVLLLGPEIVADDLLKLFIERLHVLLTGLDEQRSRVLSEIPPQKVETLIDVYDLGLGYGQPQSSFCKKCFYPRPDLCFQQLFGSAGHDEVVRVPYHTHFQSPDSRRAPLRTEVRHESAFQSIQRPIRQRWGDNTPLWRPSYGCYQLPAVDHSRLQPLPQYRLIHANVVEHPGL